MEEIIFLAGALLVTLIFIALARTQPERFSYTLSRSEILIKTFGVLASSIPYNTIANAEIREKRSRFAAYSRGYSYSNRSSNVIVLTLNDLREITIAPRDPLRFLDDLLTSLDRRT